ncbi:potassium/sodium hyperpolarization-activated cyclic nucleotide-gated channel 1-like [Fopius arisanus]|uniref:Potassium/sodium hyperpolarization-activated cyclic nucleotide-gated channel 1-like n=1 Tax=Fopius arisanus TaxID=64838 RepID=A0A9R1TEI0_9HYME|nr:PREDICTED: potassium/sodium hyperpolarization-activated cyclic nucleotide-gated channel 1-like [Fopius arisanus]
MAEVSQNPLKFTPERLKSREYDGKYKSWRLVSLHHHPRARDYFESISATNKEKRRQKKHKNWWILHPYSATRFCWETIMTFIYGISFLIIPFMTSFIIFDYDAVRLDKISLFFYIVFWIDIFLNCVTGVYVKKERIVSFDHSVILDNYLRSYLLLDVATSVPYDHLTHQWRTVPGSESSLPTVLINVIPIAKIFRYLTFHAYGSQLFQYCQIKDFTHRIISILILSFYIVHWFACFCYLTAVFVMHVQQVSVKDCSCWLAKLTDEGIPVRFQHALFIVLQNFVASGFGGIEPEFEGQMIICTVLMILGRIFEAYVIIMFLQIQNDKKAALSKYEETMNQISAYTRQKQLPPHMKKRLEDYYAYRFRNAYFRERKILSTLSSRLREEIILHSCRRLVENVILFRDLPDETILAIVTSLKFELYLPDDVIVKAGTQGDCMYFLNNGTVAVFTPTGQEVCHLEEGAHFGEVALLVQDQRRVGTVIAIEVCEVYKLERRDFRKCIAGHTKLFERIERIATQRMDRTIMIEEQHKRFPMYLR